MKCFKQISSSSIKLVFLYTCIISDFGFLEAEFDVHARAVSGCVQLPVDQHRSQERVFGVKGSTSRLLSVTRE